MAYTDTDFDSPIARHGFVERHPNAVLWLVAASQALAMLGISVLLRTLMT